MATSTEHAGHTGRGRHAAKPQDIPKRGWGDILKRTWKEIGEDGVTLVAAGVTYFLLLALFPALSALVSVYGLFADPQTIAGQVQALNRVLPQGGVQLISEQLTRLATQQPGALSLALVVSIVLALWSASAGVKAMFEAMNIAYDETEKRGFIRLNAIALGFTLAAIVGAVVLIGAVVAVPAVLAVLGLSGVLEWAVRIGSYVLMTGVLFVGLAALYRYGPSRDKAQWRWITPGALLAVVVILVVSVLFSWYASSFGNFDKTYGALGGLIAFLTWIWISVMVVIAGAELNAEAEHQTAEDSTEGPKKPMGERHAHVADTLGSAQPDGKDQTPHSGLRNGHDRLHHGEAANDDDGRAWRDGFRAGQAAAGTHRPAERRDMKLPLALAIPAAMGLLFLERRSGKRSP